MSYEENLGSYHFPLPSNTFDQRVSGSRNSGGGLVQTKSQELNDIDFSIISPKGDNHSFKSAFAQKLFEGKRNSLQNDEPPTFKNSGKNSLYEEEKPVKRAMISLVDLKKKQMSECEISQGRLRDFNPSSNNLMDKSYRTVDRDHHSSLNRDLSIGSIGRVSVNLRPNLPNMSQVFNPPDEEIRPRYSRKPPNSSVAQSRRSNYSPDFAKVELPKNEYFFEQPPGNPFLEQKSMNQSLVAKFEHSRAVSNQPTHSKVNSSYSTEQRPQKQQSCQKCIQTQYDYEEKFKFYKSQSFDLQEKLKQQNLKSETDNQIIQNLNNKVKTLQKQNVEQAQALLSQEEIKELVENYEKRCETAEQNLRQETAVNEKQRAEIVMLKQSLEIGINKLGVQFKKGKGQFIDGYLMIMEQQQLIEQQKQKIDSLNDKYQTAEAKNFEQLKQLQCSKTQELGMQEKHLKSQLEQALKFVDELKLDKTNLLEDKAVLQSKERDYLRGIKDHEMKIAQQMASLSAVERDMAQYREQNAQLTKNKEEIAEANFQKDLKVRDLEKLVNSKETTIQQNNTKLQILESENTKLQTQINKCSDQIMDLQTQLNQKDFGEILQLKNQIESLEKDIKNLQNDKNDLMAQIQKREDHIKQYTNSIVPELKTKLQEMTFNKSELQKNLEMTQDELEKLITVYEQLELEKVKQNEVKNQNDTIVLRELEQFKRKVNNFDEHLKAKQDTIDKLNQDIAESQENIDKLKAQCDKMSDANTNLKNFIKQKDEQLQQMQELEKELKEEILQNNQLKTQIDDVSYQKSQIESKLGQALSRLQLDVEHLRLEKKKFMHQLDEKNFEKKMKNAQVQTIEDMDDDSRYELQNQIEQMNQTIEELENSSKNELNSKQNLEQALFKISNLELIGDKIREIVSQLIQLNQIGYQMRQKVQLLSHRLIENIDKLNLLAKNEQHYKTEIKALRLKIDKDSQEREQLLEKCDLIQKQFQDQVEQLHYNDRQSSVTESQEYQNGITELKSQIKRSGSLKLQSSQSACSSSRNFLKNNFINENSEYSNQHVVQLPVQRQPSLQLNINNNRTNGRSSSGVIRTNERSNSAAYRSNYGSKFNCSEKENEPTIEQSFSKKSMQSLVQNPDTVLKVNRPDQLPFQHGKNLSHALNESKNVLKRSRQASKKRLTQDYSFNLIPNQRDAKSSKQYTIIVTDQKSVATANEDDDQEIADVKAAMQICDEDFEDRILPIDQHERRRRDDSYSEGNLQQQLNNVLDQVSIYKEQVVNESFTQESIKYDENVCTPSVGYTPQEVKILSRINNQRKNPNTLRNTLESEFNHDENIKSEKVEFKEFGDIEIIQPNNERNEIYFNQNVKEFSYIQPPRTEQRNSRKSLGKSKSSKTSLKVEDRSNYTRNVQKEHVEDYGNYGIKQSSLERVAGGGDTNRTRENQRIEGMIQARKKQKSKLSVNSKDSSVGTVNKSRGELSRNMVYEYNKSQILTKESSFHKNLDDAEMTIQASSRVPQPLNDEVEVHSYSDREPSIRASELKSDFRTGRSTFMNSKKDNFIKDSSREVESVYSKEESFNKMTMSKQSSFDKLTLKMDFQKNGVINISDYLDSGKDRQFNRNNQVLDEQKESYISQRNLQVMNDNMHIEEENEERSSSAGPRSGSRSQKEETFEYDIDDFQGESTEQFEMGIDGLNDDSSIQMDN